MRVLLDTNVCLDFILQRQPFFAEADEIFRRCSNNDFEAYLCSITPINIVYITRKELEYAEILQAVTDLLSMTKICRIEKYILQKALTSPITDYEDAVQHECTVAEHLDAIVTRNTKDYKNSSITIYSPSDFLKQL